MADVIEHLEVDGTTYDLPSGGGGSTVNYYDLAQNDMHGQLGQLGIDGRSIKVTMPDVIKSHPMLRAKCARAGANIYNSTFIQGLEDGSENPYSLTPGSSVIVVFGSSQLLRGAAEEVKGHVTEKVGNVVNIERHLTPQYGNHQVVVDDFFFKQDINGNLVSSGLWIPGLSDDKDLQITPYVGYNNTGTFGSYNECWAWVIVKNNGTTSKDIFQNVGYITEPPYGSAVTTVPVSAGAFLPDIQNYLH